MVRGLRRTELWVAGEKIVEVGSWKSVDGEEIIE